MDKSVSDVDGVCDLSKKAAFLLSLPSGLSMVFDIDRIE